MLSCGALLATEDSPQANACPLSDFKPDTFQVDKDKPGVPFIDEDQDLKELGTSVVVDDFFTTPDTLYNFMKLVYQRIENALAIYRKEKGLEEGSIFLLFKGGNVLRMVANEIFALLPPKARKLRSAHSWTVKYGRL